MSTVFGEHTAEGSVIIKTGTPGAEITTGIDSVEVHPDEFVTVNVNTPLQDLLLFYWCRYLLLSLHQVNML